MSIIPAHLWIVVEKEEQEEQEQGRVRKAATEKMEKSKGRER